MATVARNGQFVTRLKKALASGLESSGIRAKIDAEPIKGTRLHRVYVVASQFENLRPTERQDLVWRIVDQNFKPEEQLRISMIFTVTPEELP